MTGLWHRWVAWCERPIDARPAALVRILLPSIVVFDQLRFAWLGLVPHVYRPANHGGIWHYASSPWFVMDDLFGPMSAGWVTWALTVVSMALAALGVYSRATLLVGVLMYAQLAHGYYGVDNGGDRIARTALFFLVFSGVHQCWALTARKPSTTMPAWPVDLVRWLLVLVYFGAGFAKLFPRPANWLSWDHSSITYRIVTYPMLSKADAAYWFDWKWTMYALDVATIVVEMIPFLILTRWRKWWGLLGAPIHIGILLTMQIDIFALLMLGLYPLLFDEWIVAGLDRWKARREAASAPPTEPQ